MMIWVFGTTSDSSQIILLICYLKISYREIILYMKFNITYLLIDSFTTYSLRSIPSCGLLQGTSV